MSRRNVDRACCVFMLVAGALSASCGGARVVQGEPPPLVFDRLPPAPPTAPAPAEVSLLSLVRQRATCLRTLDGGGPWCGGPDAGALLSKSEAAGEREALETFIAALTDPDPYVAWVATLEVLTPYPSLHHDDRYSPGPIDQTGARAPSLVCTDGALGDRLLDAVERFADRPARTPSPALHIGDRVACIDIRAERRWARLEAIVRTHGSPLLRQSAVLGLRTHHADAPRVATLLRELLDNPNEDIADAAVIAIDDFPEADPTATCERLLVVASKPGEARSRGDAERAFGESYGTPGKCAEKVLTFVAGTHGPGWVPRDSTLKGIARRCEGSVAKSERSRLAELAARWTKAEKSTAELATLANEAVAVCRAVR